MYPGEKGVKQQESNSNGPDAVCGEVREAMMVSRVRSDHEEKTVRARSWDRMPLATGSHWVTAELDSTANIC